jgi:hypothetical protein
MAKPTKPTVSPFAGLKSLSDKTRAKLMTNPDAPSLEAETPPPIEPAAPTPETVPAKKKMGRPAGKRSSADYEQSTLFLKKEDKHLAQEAIRQLKAKHPDIAPEDLSDLVSNLLSIWLSNPRPLKYVDRMYWDPYNTKWNI